MSECVVGVGGLCVRTGNGGVLLDVLQPLVTSSAHDVPELHTHTTHVSQAYGHTSIKHKRTNATPRAQRREYVGRPGVAQQSDGGTQWRQATNYSKHWRTHRPEAERADVDSVVEVVVARLDTVERVRQHVAGVRRVAPQEPGTFGRHDTTLTGMILHLQA